MTTKRARSEGEAKAGEAKAGEPRRSSTSHSGR
jgi:hypothetical protein